MSSWHEEVLAIHARVSPDDREARAAQHAALVQATRRRERWIAVGNVTTALLFWAILAVVWGRPWH